MIHYFVHATSVDNEASLRSGWDNPCLSAKGRQQAIELKAAIAEYSFDAVYCSDLRKAVETTEIVFPDQPITQDERLREMNYGELNGHPKSDFPKNDNWCVHNRFPSGENCLDVQSRMRSFLSERLAVNKSIAVVSHNYPQLALEVICHGLTWHDAIKNDWRKTGTWRPGWHYNVNVQQSRTL